MKTLFQIVVAVLIAGALALLIAGALAAVANHAPTRGVASWYGDDYRGLTMANGERFDPDALSCASRDLPLNSLVRVRRVATGASLDLRVKDRGPALRTGCVLDLSRAAFARLAPLTLGRIEVEFTPLALAVANGVSQASSDIRSAVASSDSRSVVPAQRSLSSEPTPQNKTCRPVPVVAAPIARVAMMRSARPAKAIRRCQAAVAAGLQKISPERA